MEKIRDIAFIATTIDGKPFETHYLTQNYERVYEIIISNHRIKEIDSINFINELHNDIVYASLNKDDDEEINIFLDDLIKETVVSTFKDDIESAEDTIKEFNEVIKIIK